MVLPTFDWDLKTGQLKTKPDPREYEMDFSDSTPNGEHYGMPITVNAFHELLKAFLRDHADKKTFQIRFVEFSKTSINRVLLQPGCEFIRFYFVFPEKNKLSLVLEGLDGDAKPLKFETNVLKVAANGKARAAMKNDPHYEEKGNGVGKTSGSKSVINVVEKVTKTEKSNAAAFAVHTKTEQQNALIELLKTLNA